MSKIRPGIVLPDKYKELAIANRISLKTVYHRIKRGWEIEKAVTTPPSNRGESSRKNGRVHGSIRAGDRPKGSPITFTMYQDSQDLFNEAVNKSGLSRSGFVANVVEQYLRSISN
jgi:hypothetical protein